MRRVTLTILLFIFIGLGSIEVYGQDGLPCDANGSGTITAADVTALINDLRNRAPAAGNADCNDSGTVTAADVTALINVLRGRTQPPQPTVTCPCNYDISFWTRDQWVLTPNGLFNDCFSPDPSFINLFTLTGVGGFGCAANVLADGAGIGGPNFRCEAKILCQETSGDIIRIYEEIMSPLTNSELDSCLKDIRAIAAALPTNPCNSPP